MSYVIFRTKADEDVAYLAGTESGPQWVSREKALRYPRHQTLEILAKLRIRLISRIGE